MKIQTHLQVAVLNLILALLAGLFGILLVFLIGVAASFVLWEWITVPSVFYRISFILLFITVIVFSLADWQDTGEILETSAPWN